MSLLRQIRQRWPFKRQTLSVTIITQNEAAWLRRAMESVEAVADEFVIVDGGSTDETAEVVAGFPKARYIERPFKFDFAEQKDFALSQCQGDWILILDHDEMVGVRFRREVRGLMRSWRTLGFKFPRYMVHSLEPLTYVNGPEIYPARVIRLIRNRPEIRYLPDGKSDQPSSPHQDFQLRGKTRRLDDIHIFHFHGIMRSREEREARVARYNARDPSFMAVNSHQYLWEDFPHTIEPCEEPLAENGLPRSLAGV